MPTSSTATLVLPQNMDLVAAGSLYEKFLAHRGQHLVLDASGVQRFGALCLQVLIAARREWIASGIGFTFLNASREFNESLRLMGACDALGVTEASGAGM